MMNIQDWNHKLLLTEELSPVDITINMVFINCRDLETKYEEADTIVVLQIVIRAQSGV
jgi:hypothetical protein